MGKAKQVRKFGEVKRMINPKDMRLKKNQKQASDDKAALVAKQINHVDRESSTMFFKYNTALGPPYHIIIDTNFINFALQNRLELVQAMMD
ncbi:rRNA-processing protein fcf1, partial [Coemansia sp. RSA 678]